MPGAAVFLTCARDKTPPVLAWHVRRSRALHEDQLALTLSTLSIPWTAPEETVTVAHEADHFWRAEAWIGFMEHPDVPAILAECRKQGAQIDLDDLMAMNRNASRVSDNLALPCDHVVEIGREIEI